ncbi:hypothetical protein SAMN02745823_02063 [Sporobacter termitidis DSM 10068]|uniref:Uncharacterized protein n=1 Tax=Sporobacter termitidis DSM 10068 TaxID=1123282 RepID=A0A1M5XVV0_9FIRM|nr:hypothetical protein SAMN02745823_02063 [Sporobacter termitidis DSM 10068]
MEIDFFNYTITNFYQEKNKDVFLQDVFFSFYFIRFCLLFILFKEEIHKHFRGIIAV